MQEVESNQTAEVTFIWNLSFDACKIIGVFNRSVTIQHPITS